MPRTVVGPDGEKRPADVSSNAVHVMRVMLGESEEEYVDGAPKKRRRRPLRAARRREHLKSQKRRSSG